MKCPLFVTGRCAEGASVLDSMTDCLKEECAWWGTWTTERSEEATGCCLPVLTSVMSEVMNKMLGGDQR